MENERETIEVETPIEKHKVVLKKWLTVRERRAILRPYLEGMQFNLKGESGENLEVAGINPADLTEKVENIMIETIIVSVDGDSENVLEKVLNMRTGDWEFLKKKLNEVIGEKDFLK